ncbi:hypothetical protein BD410DRAFT_823284 [Rickenella mellea]|uniref:DUF6697 domain-containing protein n=1 Tax=Rickenella mellea TaxID=50990 RepID=A0A4R5XDA2_9AGAM|nr:hypothetical protein BD410DRAFT_823284 [Rickenella mellea]
MAQPETDLNGDLLQRLQKQVDEQSKTIARLLQLLKNANVLPESDLLPLSASISSPESLVASDFVNDPGMSSVEKPERGKHTSTVTPKRITFKESSSTEVSPNVRSSRRVRVPTEKMKARQALNAAKRSTPSPRTKKIVNADPSPLSKASSTQTTPNRKLTPFVLLPRLSSFSPSSRSSDSPTAKEVPTKDSVNESQDTNTLPSSSESADAAAAVKDVVMDEVPQPKEPAPPEPEATSSNLLPPSSEIRATDAQSDADAPGTEVEVEVESALSISQDEKNFKVEADRKGIKIDEFGQGHAEGSSGSSEPAPDVDKKKYVDSLNNPRISVKHAKQVSVLSTDSIFSRLTVVGLELLQINASPIDVDKTFTREFLSTTFGGAEQGLIVNVDHAKAQFLQHGCESFFCPNLTLNPYAPRIAGAPGLLFRPPAPHSSDMDLPTQRPVKVVVVFGTNECAYRGDYELRQSEPLSVDEWRQLSTQARNHWAAQIKKKKTGPHKRTQVSIFLRLTLGREPTVAEIDSFISDKKSLEALSEEQILAAFNEGSERLAVWAMKCVSFDDEFLNKIIEYLPKFVGRERGGKRKLLEDDESTKPAKSRKRT